MRSTESTASAHASAGARALLDAYGDLRYAVRTLLRAPGFTAAAVLLLALGVGGTVTMFTWMRAILLRPLPGVDSKSLLLVASKSAQEGVGPLSHPDYQDLRRSRSFQGLAVQDDVALSLTRGGRSERVWGLIVSGDYFDVLGVRPTLGRTFLPQDYRPPGVEQVAVLSYHLWQRRFGGDPAVVGTEVTLNGHPFAVIGVAPREFRGSSMGLAFDVWVPITMEKQITGRSRMWERGQRWLQGLARLKPGVSLRDAQAELDVLARQLEVSNSATNTGVGFALFTFWNAPLGGGRVLGPVVKVLAVVAVIVLLIACANLTSLLLARGLVRRREIALRLCLGVSRARLVRQLLIESVLLAGVGGAAGLLVASWCAGLLQAFTPPTDFPVSLTPQVNGPVLAFAVGLSVLTGVVFGLVPALQASRQDVNLALRDEGVIVAGRTRRGRLPEALVAAQVCMSVMLLVGAGLLIRSLQKARTLDPGFDSRGVLLANLDLVPNGYTAATGLPFYVQLLERARAVPGVQTATLARKVPLGFGGSSSVTLEVPGYVPPAGTTVWAYFNPVGPDYFRTLRVPLVRGRDFGLQDRFETAHVAIVNEAMAQRYWPQRQAVGEALTLNDDTYTVVGIARDFQFRRLGEAPTPQLFVPVLQAYHPDMTVHLRADGNPLALAAPLREVVRSIDPRLPVFAVRTLEDHVRSGAFQQRLAGGLLSAFGALALLLAILGLYALLSYGVVQRRQEIAIRMALGATSGQVLRRIVGRGLGLTGVGVALGLGASVPVARLLSSLLLGVHPADPATLSAVCVVLLAVAGVACYLPARRAVKLDPALVLRQT